MADRRSGGTRSCRYSRRSIVVNRAVTAATAAAYNRESQLSARASVSTFYSMAAGQDEEVDDALAQAQRNLRDLKVKISAQSKKNYLRERDVNFLDIRIGLLIQQRMALEEQHEMTSRLDEHDDDYGHNYLDDHHMQQYGNLFYLLQNEPRHIATLCRLVKLGEIDTLLQTVMFTLYGNQYESREEHLLLSMFQNVLAAQFETTNDFSSLLRANTPVSRMMTTYTRRGPGQAYLRAILAPEIKILLDHDDLDLEINPLKVYEKLGLPGRVTSEVAAANHTVLGQIKIRLEYLTSFARSFLKRIIQSIDEVPYGIRWICKQIRSLTKRKYPHRSEDDISAMIGGFFFLRFVNPAIVTPQAYMLIDGDMKPPNENSKTTLKLIAKLLQNLANKPSYNKEAYMALMDRFIDENIRSTNNFLCDLGEVGDFHESLEMDQYMALSKKDILIHITPNEIHNTYNLLRKHIDTLAPKSSDHLRILLDGLRTMPREVPRKENKPIELPLFSRWVDPIQDLTASFSENSITQNDILYMEVKAAFIHIIRMQPSLGKQPINLIRLIEVAERRQYFQKDTDVLDMLRKLESAGVVDQRDHFKLLTEEIAQELVHLGDLKKKVDEETESLKGVYKAIMDHNKYLKKQLEQYKEYLQNARIQSTGKGTSGMSSYSDRSGSHAQRAQRVPIGIGVEVQGKAPKKASPLPVTKTFDYQSLEDSGVIVAPLYDYQHPDSFIISSSALSSFKIEYKHKGQKYLFDFKLDDLLEKRNNQTKYLNLIVVQLDVSRTLDLLHREFMTKNTSKSRLFFLKPSALHS